MPHTVHCTHCRTRLTSKNPIPAGREINCPKCHYTFTVADEEPGSGDRRPSEDGERTTRDGGRSGGDDRHEGRGSRRRERRPRRDRDDGYGRERDDGDDHHPRPGLVPGRGMATASVALGIVGIVIDFASGGPFVCAMCCIALLPVSWMVSALGGLLGLIGTVLGIASRSSGNRSTVSIWGIVLSVLAVFMGIGAVVLQFTVLAGLSADKALQDAAAPTKDVKVGEEIRFGDLGVTVESVQVTGWTSTTAGGRPMLHEPDVVVRIKLVCHNPNRELKVRGQGQTAELADDVGNRYSRMRAENEFGLRNSIDEQISEGHARPVRSDKPQYDKVIFDKPVPGAKEVILTLDATRYDGTGKIRIVVPRAVWEGRAKK